MNMDEVKDLISDLKFEFLQYGKITIRKDNALISNAFHE